NYTYIREAFQMARDYSIAKGRNIELFFNDNDNHYPIGLTSKNSRKIVGMLKQQGLIDFVGLQMHIGEWRKGAFDELMVPGLKVELDFYKKLGVPVQFTEMTYRPSSDELNLPENQFNLRLAHVFGESLKIGLESGNLEGLWFWGPSDKYLQIVGSYQIFDADGQPKLAYYTVLKTLYEGIK
ncbi:MAG: endo-1,4-beta-xylanase, partial [Chloroflexota bacterium]